MNADEFKIMIERSMNDLSEDKKKHIKQYADSEYQKQLIDSMKGIGKVFDKHPNLTSGVIFSPEQEEVIKRANLSYKKHHK